MEIFTIFSTINQSTQVFIQDNDITSFTNLDVNLIRYAGDGSAINLDKVVFRLAISYITLIRGSVITSFTAGIKGVTVYRFIKHLATTGSVEIAMTHASAGAITINRNVVALRDSVVQGRFNAYRYDRTHKICRNSAHIQRA